MALFEKVGEVLLEGIGGKVLLGIGAVLVAPAVLPAVRPVTKQLIRGGLDLADKVKAIGSESKDQVSEAVVASQAEVARPIPAIVEPLRSVSSTTANIVTPDKEAEPPWSHLQEIPDFNEIVASAAWERGLRSFADVRQAAEDDRLRELPAIGKARQARILEWLRSQDSTSA